MGSAGGAADELGRRTDVDYSGYVFGGGFAQTFGYNERNELTDSSRDDTTPSTTWSYNYDPIGNRTESTYTPAGVEQETTYTPNKLNQYPLWYPPDGPEDGLVLSWDYDGTLLAEFQDLKADMNCDGFVDFDDINPFVLAIVSRESYEAAWPNCEWLNGDLNGDQSVDFDDINPFVAALVGGAVSEVQRGFKWNAEGRLIEYKQGAVDEDDFRAYYEYDYLGRRVYRKVDICVAAGPPVQWVTIVKRRYVWDGWKLLEELDALNSHAAARKFTWGLDLAGQNGSVNSLEGAGTIGGLLAVRQEEEDHVPENAEPDVQAGNFLFFYDGNGNVGQLVAWSDIAGWQGLGLNSARDWHVSRLAAAYEYDPYGTALSAVGYDPATQQLSVAGPEVVANRFRFSTKQWDPETGWGYWGWRYLDAALGRWTSQDPIGELGSLNVYMALCNAPLNWIDPDGRQQQPSTMPASEREERIRRARRAAAAALAVTTYTQTLPIASRLLAHWLEGTGEALELYDSEMLEIMSTRQFGAFRDLVLAAFKAHLRERYCNASRPASLAWPGLPPNPESWYGGWTQFPHPSYYPHMYPNNPVPSAAELDCFYAFHYLAIGAQVKGVAGGDCRELTFRGDITWAFWDRYEFVVRDWTALPPPFDKVEDTDFWLLQETGEAKAFDVTGEYTEPLSLSVSCCDD